MRVFVAEYQHKHGSDMRVFADESGAEKWRQELASEMWDENMTEANKPEDPAVMANQFWEDAAMFEDFFGVASYEVEGLPATADSITPAAV